MMRVFFISVEVLTSLVLIAVAVPVDAATAGTHVTVVVYSSSATSEASTTSSFPQHRILQLLHCHIPRLLQQIQLQYLYLLFDSFH